MKEEHAQQDKVTHRRHPRLVHGQVRMEALHEADGPTGQMLQVWQEVLRVSPIRLLI